MGNLIQAHYSSFEDPLFLHTSGEPSEKWLETNRYFIVDGRRLNSARGYIQKFGKQRPVMYIGGAGSLKTILIEDKGAYLYTDGSMDDISIAAFSTENLEELATDVCLPFRTEDQKNSLEILNLIKKQKFS